VFLESRPIGLGPNGRPRTRGFRFVAIGLRAFDVCSGRGSCPAKKAGSTRSGLSPEFSVCNIAIGRLAGSSPFRFPADLPAGRESPAPNDRGLAPVGIPQSWNKYSFVGNESDGIVRLDSPDSTEVASGKWQVTRESASEIKIAWTMKDGKVLEDTLVLSTDKNRLTGSKPTSSEIGGKRIP
jgi:hypothetical protein